MSGEFIMLAGVARYLQENLEESGDLWKNSPLEWILKLPPRRKSKLAGDLIAYWLTSKGIQIEAAKDSSETLLIGSYRFATKFSTLWTTGVYRFQQIRASGYDYVICFGISPFDAHCWILERKHAIEHAKPQHRGPKVADYWLEINPGRPSDWILDHGGSLEKGYRILKSLLKK